MPTPPLSTLLAPHERSGQGRDGASGRCCNDKRGGGIRNQRNVVMIANRLSPVKGCEMLHYRKDGRVEGAGDYQSLGRGHQEFRETVA